MKLQYKSYQETIDFLKECVKNYPNMITTQSIGTTWEGREIVMATISLDIENASLKPALLFTGTIHAREWIGNELAIGFIDYLLKNYQDDPRITTALRKNTLYMVPCLNPDGFEYSRTHFSFWRKNRRDNKDGTFGVDLNRNFSIGFSKNSDTTSNIYGGPSAFSEPETKAIKEFVDSHENITIALDYHSQGNVFFPAHKFNHEAEINGTDLNILCANMNYEIHKITGREYGIHRGKPPAKLIAGSGREYYYSKGIIATVVEVGTRNIPDYMQNMQESINENIPALLYALSEAKNYSHFAPSRVKDFQIEQIFSDKAILTWDHENDSRDIFFELHRSHKNKQASREDTLIAKTKARRFEDCDLESGTEYFYYIRAVDMINNLKSPFAPTIKLTTLLNRDEFSKTIFPLAKKIGYVAQKSIEQNRDHFGKNSLFIGINESKGISYGVMEFSLENIPKDAIIHETKISMYPMNRVNAKIEKFGEWSLSLVDSQSVSEISDFEQIHEANIIQSIGDSIKSEKLTQGIWSHWNLNQIERKLLQKELTNDKVIFRIQGPKTLPIGRDSQMMMFDLGYGPFGGGIHYRPHIDIKYTLPSKEIKITPSRITSISKDENIQDILSCGFDKDGDKIYGYMDFDLSNLPDPDKTIITDAYIKIKNENTPKTKRDIRYNIEFIDIEKRTYKQIKQRDRIEFIGYEISQANLKKDKSHYFLFDSFSKLELEEFHKNDKYASFIVKANAEEEAKNTLVNWYKKGDKKEAKLIIKYINRRKFPVEKAQNLNATIEKGMTKLTWENPNDEDFVGVYVVRNRFHPPKNPYDGVKLYAGQDNYTYDNFGSTKIDKYYAVFTYDDVPNYAEPETIYYKAK